MTRCASILALIVLTSGAASSAGAAEPPKGPPSMPTPGPEHQALLAVEGTWDAVITMPMAPGQPALVSAGTMICKRLGGFWLVCDFASDMGGLPFEGHQVQGFDLKAKRHTIFWIDSMGDWSIALTGVASKDAKVITYTGKAPDMSGKVVTWTEVLTFMDADHMGFSMTTSAQKKGAPMMSVAYTRRR